MNQLLSNASTMNHYKTLAPIWIPALLVLLATSSLGMQNQSPITIGKILTKEATPNIWRKIGDNVVLNCTVLSGGPVKSIKWKKHGKRITATQQGPRWSALVVKTVKESDAGQYKCVVRGWTKDVSHVHLHVKGRPRFLTGAASRSIGPIFLVQGESIRLDCFAEAEPKPSFYWKKDGKRVNSVWGTAYMYIHRKNGIELSIVDAQKEQEGLYTCVANNSIGSNNYSVRVFVRVPPKAVPSNISAVYKSVAAIEGNNVSLTCRIRCSPRLNVLPEWFIDETRRIRKSKKFDITDTFYLDPKGNSAHIHMVNTTLTIRNLTRADGKKYVCAAWTIGSWPNLPFDSVQLTVLPKAKNEERVTPKIDTDSVEAKARR